MSKESDARKRMLNGEQEKKTRYEYAKKSNEKYLSGLDRITTRVPKGEKELWRIAADRQGKSLNQYVTDLMHAANPDLFSEKSE